MTHPGSKKIDLVSRLAWLVATAGGAGFVPRLPGTAGSVVGLILGILVHQSQMALVVLTAGVIVLALWSGGRAERLAGKKDAPQIVIDEVAGMLLCLVGITLTPATLILSFVLFRAMDIGKVFPACRAQRLPGSLGILLDDVIAAAYTQVLVRLMIPFLAP